MIHFSFITPFAHPTTGKLIISEQVAVADWRLKLLLGTIVFGRFHPDLSGLDITFDVYAGLTHPRVLCPLVILDVCGHFVLCDLPSPSDLTSPFSYLAAFAVRAPLKPYSAYLADAENVSNFDQTLRGVRFGDQ